MKKKKVILKGYRAKPANFVLWYTLLSGFFVSEKSGTKISISELDHFARFFTHESDAWESAEERTLQQIESLEEKIEFYKREQRRSK